MDSDRRLLILSCSQRKRPDPGLLPAIERYDGPSFRVLRRFLREHRDTTEQLDVFILSAVYGLIPAQHPIPDYNRIMTSQCAAELRDNLLNGIGALFNTNVYSGLCLAMSKVYLTAIEDWPTLVPPGIQVTLADGQQGVRLARLKRWLWGDARDTQTPRMRRTPLRNGACIRGVEVNMTLEQVLDAARKALADHLVVPDRYHLWHVLVDGQRVAPKWLVSQLTGLPVSGFHSHEARRVLQQLGIEVHLSRTKETQ